MSAFTQIIVRNLQRRADDLRAQASMAETEAHLVDELIEAIEAGHVKPLPVWASVAPSADRIAEVIEKASAESKPGAAEKVE